MTYRTRMICSVIFLFFLIIPQAFGSWAYAFVVYNGGIYRVTDETIDHSLIGKQIGKVSFYSDVEGTYSGNFSNVYPKGTPYYAIQGINSIQAIAVKTNDDLYVKAVYEGEYARKEESSLIFVVLGIIVFITLLILTAFFVQKSRKL